MPVIKHSKHVIVLFFIKQNRIVLGKRAEIILVNVILMTVFK